MRRVWAVVPAAGSGSRFGGAVAKQYLVIEGRPLIAHTLDALLSHPRVEGVMVALAAADSGWPGLTKLHGKPVLTCAGGSDRAASVAAALEALRPAVGDDALVLVHDAARPNLRASDMDRIIDVALAQPDGALLGAPVRDTLKRVDAHGRSLGTEPRELLWRAFTPQACQLGRLREALAQARNAGIAVTDEAMALERAGFRPALVEGRDDNIKVTTPADAALVAHLLRATREAAP